MIKFETRPPDELAARLLIIALRSFFAIHRTIKMTGLADVVCLSTATKIKPVVGIDYDEKTLRIYHTSDVGRDGPALLVDYEVVVKALQKNDLRELEANSSIQVKLNNDYTATVSEDGIKVHCQTFPLSVVADLAAAVAKVEKPRYVMHRSSYFDDDTAYFRLYDNQQKAVRVTKGGKQLDYSYNAVIDMVNKGLWVVASQDRAVQLSK